MSRALLVLATWMLALPISACSNVIKYSQTTSQSASQQARNTNMSVQTDVEHDPQQKKTDHQQLSIRIVHTPMIKA